MDEECSWDFSSLAALFFALPSFISFFPAMRLSWHSSKACLPSWLALIFFYFFSGHRNIDVFFFPLNIWIFYAARVVFMRKCGGFSNRNRNGRANNEPVINKLTASMFSYGSLRYWIYFFGERFRYFSSWLRSHYFQRKKVFLFKFF